MTSILKSLRLVADPSRARIVLLLEQEELSVAELQEILGMGQSTLSTHLAQLKQAGIVEDRRTGKNILYRLKSHGVGERRLFEQLMGVLRQAAARNARRPSRTRRRLRLVRQKRRDKVRAYFDELAGKFGRQYVPGRSWKGLAETLLLLVPPLVIADLGAGEGTVSQLLARRAQEVIAVDNSEKMVEFGSALARKHGVRNLHYRKGDLEALPIEDRFGGRRLFQPVSAPCAAPGRARGRSLPDSQDRADASSCSIWSSTTARRPGSCMPICGWVSRRSKSGGFCAKPDLEMSPRPWSIASRRHLTLRLCWPLENAAHSLYPSIQLRSAPRSRPEGIRGTGYLYSLIE